MLSRLAVNNGEHLAPVDRGGTNKPATRCSAHKAYRCTRAPEAMLSGLNRDKIYTLCIAPCCVSVCGATGRSECQDEPCSPPKAPTMGFNMRKLLPWPSNSSDLNQMEGCAGPTILIYGSFISHFTGLEGYAANVLVSDTTVHL